MAKQTLFHAGVLLSLGHFVSPLRRVALSDAVPSPSQTLRITDTPLSGKCLWSGGLATMQAAFLLARNNTVLADSTYPGHGAANGPIFERKWHSIVIQSALSKLGASLAQAIFTYAPVVRMQMLSGRARPVSA